MVAKISEVEISEVIDLVFNKGFKFKDACSKVGRSQAVLSKMIRNMGYDIPRETGKNTRKKTDDESIVDMYKNGYSELEVSKHFGISRALVRSRLIEHGVQPRSQSEASMLSASRVSFEDRKKRIFAANMAVSGCTQTIESRIKRAKFLEDNAYEFMTGHGELELKSVFEKMGIDFVWQKAEHKYSLDFRIGDVALELKSGDGNRGYTDVKNGRIKYLKEELGISTIYVVFDSVDSLLSSVNYILEKVNNCAIGIGEYWVISCRKDMFNRKRNNLGQFYVEKTEPRLVNKLIPRCY